MATRATLFLPHDIQAVPLPGPVAFNGTVRDMTILRDGPRRIIVPANLSWDDFFGAPGTDLGSRDQPEAQPRGTL